MDSKKKQKEWACDKGCDLSREMCPHLANKLPSLKRGLYNQDTIAEYVRRHEQEPYAEVDRAKLKLLIKAAGITALEAELLLLNKLDRLSPAEIAKRYGFVDPKAIHRTLQATRDKLKGLGRAYLEELLK